MWYDVNKTLSYNCLFNFIVGNRGSGKTYGLLKRAVKLYLDKGQHFVYLRRYENELDEVKESIFNALIINNEYPEHNIEFKNDKYYIDGELFGYAMALTKAKNYKSISYPLVYLIIFDEFLIEDSGYSRYLKNEVKAFLSFYMTIDRYRGTTVFFLANAVSLINPYTLYFKLKLPYNSNIVRKDDVLLELVQDEEFINERKNTRFGKLISGTEFEEYAIENKFMDNTNTFIEKKSAKANYYFTIKYNSEMYGIWVDYSQGRFYVSEDYEKSCKLIYSFTQDDHTPNTMLIKRATKAVLLKPFIEAYKDGCVYFENLKTKNIIYEVIRLILA